jgi:hypothetical protein
MRRARLRPRGGGDGAEGGAGRDILALSTASVIQALPHADFVDDLRFTVVPRDHPWRATAPARRAAGSRWELAETTTFAQGAVGLHCRRRT